MKRNARWHRNKDKRWIAADSAKAAACVWAVSHHHSLAKDCTEFVETLELAQGESVFLVEWDRVTNALIVKPYRARKTKAGSTQ